MKLHQALHQTGLLTCRHLVSGKELATRVVSGPVQFQLALDELGEFENSFVDFIPANQILGAVPQRRQA